MSGLVEFLRARLDEDEAAAKAADPLLGHLVAQVEYIDADVMTDGKHLDSHLPARVLAEVEAKRRILDDVLPTMRADELRIAGEWGVGSEPVREASDDLLSLLALPYADHPDYREEWKP